MAHAAPAGAEVAFPEPPHPEGAAAGPAGGHLPPHIVTPRNASAGFTRTGAVAIIGLTHLNRQGGSADCQLQVYWRTS